MSERTFKKLNKRNVRKINNIILTLYYKVLNGTVAQNPGGNYSIVTL